MCICWVTCLNLLLSPAFVVTYHSLAQTICGCHENLKYFSVSFPVSHLFSLCHSFLFCPLSISNSVSLLILLYPRLTYFFRCSFFSFFSPLTDFLLLVLQMHQLQCWVVPPLLCPSRYLTSTRTTSFLPGSHPVLMEPHLWRVIMWKGDDWPESPPTSPNFLAV